ncbi:hypothetical protein QX233_20545, partial [Chryseobacterium gambrini]
RLFTKINFFSYGSLGLSSPPPVFFFPPPPPPPPPPKKTKRAQTRRSIAARLPCLFSAFELRSKPLHNPQNPRDIKENLHASRSKYICLCLLN